MSGTNSLCVGGAGFGASLGTYFITIAGFGYNAITTESQQQITVQSSYTFSNMGINSLSASGGTTYTFRINGVDGNQTLTQTIGGNGWVSDATHSDAVIAGKLVNVKYGSGGALTTERGFSFQQNCATPSVLYAMGSGNFQTGIAFPTSTAYAGIIGCSDAINTTNSDSNKTRVQAAGTLSKFGMNVITGSSGAVTATCYNNGSTGNQALAIASGTGFFQDTTHSDSILAATDISSTYVSANASGTWSLITYQFAGVVSVHDIGASYDGGIAGSGGIYHGFGGSGSQSSATENQEYFVQPYALTASGLRARTTTGNAATTTIDFRKNSANGNQTISFVLTSGVVIDATHTDSLIATDTFNYVNTGDTDISSVLVSLDDGSSDFVTGAGAIALNIALAAAGTGIFQSEGAIGLNIAVAGAGTNIKPAAGAIGLNIAVAGAATGINLSAGAIGLHIDVAGTPKYTFPAAAAVGLNIGVAGAGINASISPGGGDVPLDQKDWKRRYGRWKEIEEELIAAEEARRGKIRAGVVDAYERSVEGKTDPEQETEPEPFKLPAITRQYSAQELGPLLKYGSIRKHSPSNHDEQDDEEAILHL